MKKIIYISPGDLEGINAISKLANSELFLEYLQPINYHSILFSTLYQSGADLFELNKSLLPDKVLNTPFWKDRFVNVDNAAFSKHSLKARDILLSNFDTKLDETFRAPQYLNLRNHFTSLFYSAEMGIPFVNPEFADPISFDFLESRLSKELFIAIRNLNSLVSIDKYTTIAPQYEFLLKDVRRFEDIANSTLYLNYSNSISLLSESTRIESAKKEINSNALKVYNKYARHLDLKSMSFGFLRFGKNISDMFTSKPVSLFGDFLIDGLEKTTTNKRKVIFYKIREAHYMIQWMERFSELWKIAGKDKIDELIHGWKK